MLNVDAVFVVHVKHDLERELWMHKQLENLRIPFRWMLEADLEELSPEDLQQYFSGTEMAGPARPAHSCALKHLFVYRTMISEGLQRVLVLEDDAILSPQFIPLFNHMVAEWESLPQAERNMALINLENSLQVWVPRHLRKKNKIIYSMQQGRATGAYFIPLHLAKAIWEHALEHGCHRPIDWYHNDLTTEIGLKHYWTHPTFVEQGSHNGTWKSRIDKKPASWFRKITWQVQLRLKSLFAP
ncbi:MAG: glycosyltransferase family 25 protein [Bacteroidetes bacterium]|nr:glycosyltransferase family 25 protein [Bacteroidota bacterium]